MKDLSIYIHIPFCKSKCIYCDFYSITDTKKVNDYIIALKKQIKNFRKKHSNNVIKTIYFGGGTPSLLEPSQLGEILDCIRTYFSLSPNCEISIESNPGTLTSNKLSQYRMIGINRLSIGLQSCHDDELKTLSRTHTRKEFEQAFIMAKIEGFNNINVDLMYGLPNQTKEKLMESIKYIVSLDPDHISLYSLKVEPNTPLAQMQNLLSSIPNEEEQYDMFIEARSYLENNGFLQYEISNFAKRGKECKHNLTYWHSNNYIGFGCAAASFYNGELYSYVKDIDTIITYPTNPIYSICESSLLSIKEQAKQYLMLAFRLNSGIDVKEYHNRFKLDFELEYLHLMQKYIDNGFILKTNVGYCLSKDGLLVSNYILSDILDFTKKE